MYIYIYTHTYTYHSFILAPAMGRGASHPYALSRPDEPVVSSADDLVPAALHPPQHSMLLEVTRKDIKPSGAGSAAWSSPACVPRIKLENSSRRMVGREAENMAKPAGATLRS